MKKSQNITSEKLSFLNKLPEEIIAELSDELKMQYHFWDRLHKRQIELYPHSILPLVKETFQRVYPKGTQIILLSTEYIVTRIHTEGGKTLNSILADAVVQIGSDLYHIECQMSLNEELIIRMLEYDLHIALTHSLEKQLIKPTDTAENPSESSPKPSFKYRVHFPKSAILYLGTTSDVSNKMECELVLGNDQTTSYQIDVVKVQDFSLEDIEQKHLNILIPFLPIRYKASLQSQNIKRREKARKELTDLLKNCTMILKHENDNGTIGETEKKDILDFLHLACTYLFEKDPVTMKEVNQVLFPEIKLHREVCEEQKQVIETQQNQLLEKESIIQEKDSVIQEQAAKLKALSKRLAELEARQ